MNFDVRCNSPADMTQEYCDCILDHYLFEELGFLLEIVSK